jgi:hypothetical protein
MSAIFCRNVRLSPCGTGACGAGIGRSLRASRLASAGRDRGIGTPDVAVLVVAATDADAGWLPGNSVCVSRSWPASASSI